MYSTNDYAIVTPTHKSILSESEIARIRLTTKSNGKYKHFFVLPESQDTVFFVKKFPDSKIVFFEDRFFKNFENYNLLLLLPVFYNKFLQFKKIIICQPDAFIFRAIDSNLLDSFLYLGASWNPSFMISEFANTIFVNKSSPLLRNNHRLESGNGGLSIRDPLVIHEILKNKMGSKHFDRIVYENRKINEDLMIVFLLKKNGILPIPKVVADEYFIETTKSTEFNLQKILGFHALAKHNPKLEDALISDHF